MTDTLTKYEHPAVAALRDMLRYDDLKPADQQPAVERARKALAASAAHDEAFADMLAALHSAAASLEQFIKLNRIPANNAGLRDARAAIAKATKAEGS